MPKFTVAQRAIISKNIYDMDRVGYITKEIQKSLANMDFNLTISKIERYKGGIAKQEIYASIWTLIRQTATRKRHK